MANENEWGSNLTFILAMIGSAVGLGNIWRYPYVLYSNGGGAFYIPYLVAILILGIPFLILEYGVGYNFKSSFAKAISNIDKRYEFLGWFIPLALFMILVYYSCIMGWDGIYIVLSFFKGWGTDPNVFFTNTLLQSDSTTIGFIPIIAVSMLVSWLLMWFISHKNLDEGLGKVSKILVPLLFIIMVFIVVFSLTLPGANIGLNILFNPDWSLLLDFRIWMAAFGQIIFSLSLGMSIAFTYASYTKEGTDLITNTISIAFANSLFENFAALAVFSILGYMSLQSGVSVPDLVTQGTGLVFIAYPMVFNVLGDWAYILGPMFFITVYLAGLTSFLSTIEPLSFSIQNKFGWSRSRTVTILSIVAAALSMIYATSMGPYILGIVDGFVNQIAILIGVVGECIVFAWIFKAEKLIKPLNSKSKTIKLGTWWLSIVKYILPLLIIIVWIGGIFDLIQASTTFELIFLLGLAVGLTVFTLIFTKLSPKSDDYYTVNERL